jgi:hypothetical protein
MRNGWLAVAIASWASSCDPHGPAVRAKLIGACEVEALRQYPGQTLETSNDIGTLMRACMAAKGYEFDVLPSTCKTSWTAERDPGCYHGFKG